MGNWMESRYLLKTMTKNSEHDRDLEVESGAVGFAEEGELTAVLTSEVLTLVEAMLPRSSR